MQLGAAVPQKHPIAQRSLQPRTCWQPCEPQQTISSKDQRIVLLPKYPRTMLFPPRMMLLPPRMMLFPQERCYFHKEQCYFCPRRMLFLFGGDGNSPQSIPSKEMPGNRSWTVSLAFAFWFPPQQSGLMKRKKNTMLCVLLLQFKARS